MKWNDKKVNELTDSWINGNKNYVREKVKRLNKLEFYFLVSNISSLTNYDGEEISNKLVSNH